MQARGSKKGAKMGQYIASLNEHAHQKIHDEAVEKRKKKKENSKSARIQRSHDHKDDADTEASTSDKSSEDWDQEDHPDDHHEEDNEQSLLPDIIVTKERMNKIILAFGEHLKSFRGADPGIGLFDDVMVDAYGSKTPLQAVAQITISSATLANASCYDPALAKDVAKAIREQMENLNPSVEENGVVRIPLPRVSMETRQEMAALLGKRTESFRQRVRSVRRKVMDKVKKGVAGKLEGVSKDDAFRLQQDIESLTQESVAKLNEAAKQKHDEILKV
jgi:ribosome recycling factor